jgi:rod shape determining protein RodA
VLALVGLGSLLVWSATRQRMLDADLDPQAFLKRHLINAGHRPDAGVGRDARRLPVAAGVRPGGLPCCRSAGSSRCSRRSGRRSTARTRGSCSAAGFQVQPAELAKVALVVGMAMLLADVRDGERGPRDGDVVLALPARRRADGADHAAARPRHGARVHRSSCWACLAVSARRRGGCAGWLVAGVLTCVTRYRSGVLDDYQVDRFAAFANPELDPRGVGYNTNQARIAIGSGGVFGKGLFQGTQTAGRFIPEQQTDFVFTVAGEELGLVGASVLLALLGLVLWRGLGIAGRSPDAFGRLVATGVVAWFAFQSFVNIGMTLGIMPVTGLPLPFVSYGGSAMFANLVAVGLLQNVHLRSREL